MTTVAQTFPNTFPQIRTQAELDELKREWIADGTWDIETTEGFEAHYDELKAFAVAYLEAQTVREQKEEQRHREGCRAEQRQRWGHDISDAACDYMASLEKRVSALEKTVSLLKPSSIFPC